jgi:hypothetical protein
MGLRTQFRLRDAPGEPTSSDTHTPDVFAAEPENRIAREERGGGKTSVVGSPM